MLRQASLVLVAAALLAACAQDTESEPLDDPDALVAPSVEEVKIDMPTAVLEPRDGVRVSFYAYDDTSAAMMIELFGYARLPEEQLEGTSVAEAFYAISEPGTPIPDGLMKHHEALVATGDAAAWSVATNGRPQGWLLDAPIPYDDPEYCDNLFFALYCFDFGYDLHHCYYDQDEDDVRYYMLSISRKVKTGYCIDVGIGGNNYDNLTYWYTSDCAPTGSPVVVYTGSTDVPWYRYYTWTATIFSASRRYVHQTRYYADYLWETARWDYGDAWTPDASCY